MSAATSTGVIHRQAGTAPAVWAMGSLFERLASRSETQGLDIAVVTQPPGIATPLHRHTHESEAFYLLEGTMTYRAGDELLQLVAGDFLYLPPSIPHAFRVTGTTPVRFLGIADPGGLFDLYAEVGMSTTQHRLPGPDGIPMNIEIERWNEVGPRYGLQVVGPPLPPED